MHFILILCYVLFWTLFFYTTTTDTSSKNFFNWPIIPKLLQLRPGLLKVNFWEFLERDFAGYMPLLLLSQ